MAEAVAVIGLASSIVQFVDFSSKVIKRLQEFQSSLKEKHNIFADLIIILPLMRDTLDRLCHPSVPNYQREETEEVLLPVIRACVAQVEFLEGILEKTIPDASETSSSKRWKALCSLAREEAVKCAAARLNRFSNSLNFHQSVHASYLSTQVLHRLIALEEFTRTIHESVILEAHPTRQSSPRTRQPGPEGNTFQEVPASSERDGIGAFTRPPRQAKKPPLYADRSGTRCLNDRCACSCHEMLSRSGRFWSLKLPSLAKLFSVCDRPSCGNRILRTSFHISLTRFNILRAIHLGLGFAWGKSGYSLSLKLRPARTVKYTSPGFALLWKCETGQLQWPEAQKTLSRLFDEKEASPDDVDPGGETWLEVSSA